MVVVRCACECSLSSAGYPWESSFLLRLTGTTWLSSLLLLSLRSALSSSLGGRLSWHSSSSEASADRFLLLDVLPFLAACLRLALCHLGSCLSTPALLPLRALLVMVQDILVDMFGKSTIGAVGPPDMGSHSCAPAWFCTRAPGHVPPHVDIPRVPPYQYRLQNPGRPQTPPLPPHATKKRSSNSVKNNETNTGCDQGTGTGRAEG